MDRRKFLNASMATAVAAALPNGEAAAASELAPPPIGSPWRTFDVITEVEIWPQEIPGKVWVPLSLYGDTEYQRTSMSAGPAILPAPASTVIPCMARRRSYAQWDDRAVAPKLQVTNRITTKNRNVDLTRPGVAEPISRAEIDLYLQPSAHIPTDGIVRATASKILPIASTNPIDRARAIYEWIVVNTYRDPKVIGCGTGDIKFMLESGNLGGKCADLNACSSGWLGR